MQVSLNWLNEFVDLSDIEASQIAHELTMSGLEVEAVEDVKPMFTNIKTVKIEKLMLIQIQTDFIWLLSTQVLG